MPKKDKKKPTKAVKEEKPQLNENGQKINQDISATGVLTSLAASRDIKIESFTLSYHGRLLISDSLASSSSAHSCRRCPLLLRTYLPET